MELIRNLVLALAFLLPSTPAQTGQMVDKYFPMSNGDNRYYQDRDNPSYKATEFFTQTNYNGHTVFSLNFHDEWDGYPFAIETWYLGNNGGAIALYGINTAWGNLAFNSAANLMTDQALTNNAAMTNTVTGLYYVPGSGNVTFNVTVQTTVSSIPGSVTVPAGTFTDCKLVLVVETSSYLGVSQQSFDSAAWVLAPGVGIIEDGVAMWDLDTGAFTFYDQFGNPLDYLELISATIADTQKPAVSIASPTSGTTYTNSQTVAISAVASDNIGVTKVVFYDGTTSKATNSAFPYIYNWSIAAVDNGSHVWSARAYDAAGNSSTSAAVTLTVNIDTTPPTIAISSPANGANVSSSVVTVSGTAADPGVPASGLAVVELRVNGGSWSNATGIASWTRSVTLAPCSNTVEARSRDYAGNYSTNASIIVTFTPPNTVPNTPMNVYPPNGATGVSVTPALQASPFVDSDPVCLGDTHAASQWQVLSAGGAIVADSGTDTVNKVSWLVPSNRLFYGSNYQWHVRYRDSRSGWSGYSTQTQFTNGGPRLLGLQQGTNFVLKWPTNAPSFSLQWSTDPANFHWSNATPAPQVVSGQYTVTNGMTNKARFYRLKK